MNSYEEKQAARKERLEDRAERLKKEGAAKIESGMSRLRAIPFGQPILVGHYSERRDRNYRRKAVNTVNKGCELQTEAAEVARRAESVGTGGISSDDPDAVVKLTEKLAGLEALQAKMVAANKLVRKFKADKVAGAAALVAAGYTEKVAAGLFEPDFCGRLGFPSYMLTNNNGNMARIRDRIAALKRNATRETKAEERSDGIRIVQNAEANRLQIFFPGKPEAEVRTKLKGSGFRWSPTEGAWQRQLSNGAIYAANAILGKIESEVP